MKNIVTGGAGFIGSNLINRLSEMGEEVICIDNLQTSTISNIKKFANSNKFTFIKHNLQLPIEIKADRIWHLACPASPIHYQKNPIETSKTIYLGTKNMLELANETGAKILFASSSEIYGQASKFPQTENDYGYLDLNSKRTCYALGKKYAESLCSDFKKIHNIELRVARIFNTYGPNLSPEDGRVISNFICNSIMNKPLLLHGDGKQTRTFCYIDDCIDGLLKLMNSSYSNPVNIGGNQEINILNLSKRISKKLSHYKVPIQVKKADNDPIRRKPDIKLAKKLLNWEPSVSLDEGLDKTIIYFKALLGKQS